MANWIGASRTNYFHCDLPALEKAIEPFDLSIEDGEDGTVMLSSEDADTGAWPSFGQLDVEEADEGYPDEIEFSFETIVMPHVAEGEVVIAMSVGAEKLRYASGYAEAFIRRGDKVESCGINLEGIYTLAANTFGVQLAAITAAEY